MAEVIGDGDFDGSKFVVALEAAEGEAALGDVVALDDFFASGIETDASGEVNASTNVEAQIGFAAGSELRLSKGGRRSSGLFRGDGSCDGRRREQCSWDDVVESDGRGGVRGFRRRGRGKNCGSDGGNGRRWLLG
jgi:hypothetical protein